MNRVGLDSLPPVTEDEALELCVHHLQLAGIYAMNVSEDLVSVLEEAKSLVRPTYDKDPLWTAIRAFLIASQEAHDEIKKGFEQAQDDVTERFDETIKAYVAHGPLAQAKALLKAASAQLHSLDHDVPVDVEDIDAWLEENEVERSREAP